MQGLSDLQQDAEDSSQELADSRLIFFGQTNLGKTSTIEAMLVLTTTQVCCTYLSSLDKIRASEAVSSAN